jgi:hypothetical protein
MATRLKIKRKKQIKDRVTAHKKNPSKHPHKVDQANAKKMKARKINRAR